MGLDPAILGTLSSAQAPLLSLQEQLYRGLYILCGFCFAIVAVLISVRDKCMIIEPELTVIIDQSLQSHPGVHIEATRQRNAETVHDAGKSNIFPTGRRDQG